MKKRKILVTMLLLLLAVAVVVFGGCRKAETLPAPQNLSFEERLFSWDAVENAIGYVVLVDDKEYETEETSFAVIDITAGRHELFVMAIGDGQDFNNSPLSQSISYTLAEGIESGNDEIGWYYKMLEDGTGYEVYPTEDEWTYATINAQHLKGDIKIPDFFMDYPVKCVVSHGSAPSMATQINPQTGAGCNVVTTGIEFPKYLKKIGSVAFMYFVKIEEINIPDGVTIDIYAFSECRSLKKIKLPSDIKEIPAECFENTPLESIELPNSLQSIGNNAFACKYKKLGGKTYHVDSLLSSVTIPASVKSVGGSVFNGRENLQEVNILSEELDLFGGGVFGETAWWESQPDGLVYVRDILCDYKGEMPKNSEITIPSSIKYIAGTCFMNQHNMKKVVLQDGQKIIGANTFASCSSLTEVVLPQDLTDLPESTFSGCSNLQKITVPSKVKSIGSGCFSGCSALSEVILPDGLEEIGSGAFSRCSALTEITLPNTLKVIVRRAFANIGLVHVELPESVESIAEYAFDTKTLLTIVLPKSLKSISAYALPNQYTAPDFKYIYYKGTAEEFLKIDGGADIVDIYGSKIYYYSQTEPTEVGNYWRYVDGVATVWDSTVSATEKLDKPTYAYTYEQQTIWFKEN